MSVYRHDAGFSWHRDQGLAARQNLCSVWANWRNELRRRTGGSNRGASGIMKTVLAERTHSRKREPRETQEAGGGAWWIGIWRNKLRDPE